VDDMRIANSSGCNNTYLALKEKQKTKEFANMVWVLQILKVVEDDKIDVKHIEHQGKDENVSITIENSPKIMLIDIENS
jgi:hypothetical protein